jgi:hypothetical protein
LRSRSGLIALCAAICAALVPAAAQAATSSYAPGADAQTFAASEGGWTNTHEITGLLCIPPVTCPDVTNSWVPAGGANGENDGFIRSKFESVIAALGATSVGVWKSPEFTYKGAKGARAAKLVFSADQRSNVSALLELPQAEVTYDVAIVEAGDGGARVPVISAAAVPGQQGWTAIDPVSLPANALEIGDRYYIEIRTSVMTPILSAVHSGEVDYDNVRLTAKSTPKKALKQDVKEGFGDVAATNGPKAAVALRCPAAVAPAKCRIKVAVKLGRKIVTKRKSVTLRAGKAKAVTLKVKKRFWAKILKAKRVVVQAKVKAGPDRFTARKRVKLRTS